MLSPQSAAVCEDPVRTNDFSVLRVLMDTLVGAIMTTGICARILHGELHFTVIIQDGKIVHRKIDPILKI